MEEYEFTSSNIDPRKPQHPDEYLSDQNEITIEGNFTIMEELQPTEVEKAQASVKEWQEKVDYHKKELHFAEKNLKVHQLALKKLQEIEK